MTKASPAILVADIGGTSARLALARRGDDRVVLDRVEVVPTGPGSSLEDVLRRYVASCAEEFAEARLGLPGPIRGDRVRTTNLPWEVDRREIEGWLGVGVRLLNDLEAAALGVELVPTDRITEIKPGDEVSANRAVIAPGTGLGEALLVRHEGGWIASASEGGHTDFGPISLEDIDLLRHLLGRHGRVSYERVVSGPGLVELARFHAQRLGRTGALAATDAAGVAGAARDGCEASRAAVGDWWRYLAAEAGNLALKSLALGGVFVAGGMAPKLLEFFEGEAFAGAFEAKGRYAKLMAQIPVRLIDDRWLALRGAAVSAPGRP